MMLIFKYFLHVHVAFIMSKRVGAFDTRKDEENVLTYCYPPTHRLKAMTIVQSSKSTIAFCSRRTYFLLASSNALKPSQTKASKSIM